MIRKSFTQLTALRFVEWRSKDGKIRYQFGRAYTMLWVVIIVTTESVMPKSEQKHDPRVSAMAV